MHFQETGLSEPILLAIASEGYTTPTPIQTKAIPHVLAGSDLLGCAQTGTGKTAAFALPILHRLASVQTSKRPSVQSRNGRKQKKEPCRPRALILSPTRELASQIGESFAAYGKNLSLSHVVIFGGVGQHPQVRSLQRGVDIIVATPGRLLDLMNQGHVDLSAIEVFVLDEADRMLDMGFIHDIRKIVAKVPAKRQTLLFSATMPSDIRALASSILNNPVNVAVDPVSSAVEVITQSVYFVPKKSKPALLAHLLKRTSMDRTLVFTRTKHGADRVVKELTKAGIRAAAIHGNKSQNNRTRALDSFKGTNPPVLVATDIASRGIDVDLITHVVNFDLPNVAETYVHRIGRTARAGASGAAISFCDADERNDLRAIERLINRKIDVSNDCPQYATAAPPQPAPQRMRREERTRTGGGRNSQGIQSRSGQRTKQAGMGGRSSKRNEQPQHSDAKHNRAGGSRSQSASSKRSGKPGFQQRGRGRNRTASR